MDRRLNTSQSTTIHILFSPMKVQDIYARHEYSYRSLRTDNQPPLQAEIEQGGHRAILHRQETDFKG